MKVNRILEFVDPTNVPMEIVVEGMKSKREYISLVNDMLEA